MTAPERFVQWMSTYTAKDHKHGRKVYRYHPRSDEHSKTLCRFVLDDLLAACPSMAEHVKSGRIVAGINAEYTFASGKKKNLDLALWAPTVPDGSSESDHKNPSDRTCVLRVSVEAKQCMTEHGKSEPRIFDELSSSHEIVHQAHPQAIAAGIVVVNIADRFASPLRQKPRGPVAFTPHRQPKVADSMVRHLRGLKTRDRPGEVGFDAFAAIVVNCDNTGICALHTESPAPQPGDRDHYQTFVGLVSAAYSQRFA